MICPDRDGFPPSDFLVKGTDSHLIWQDGTDKSSIKAPISFFLSISFITRFCGVGILCLSQLGSSPFQAVLSELSASPLAS